jgi:hypothetical protein
MSCNSTDTEIFVYTGEVGALVPHNVVRVRVDPSVTSIPEKAFFQRKKLTEVELCEGLVEIGRGSFQCCGLSITKINIPNSLRRINDWAFDCSLRTPICLHDGIETIGENAFARCIFTNFRVPPLITLIPNGVLFSCRSMFSLEIPKSITEIRNFAFYNCYCLRNVAFPPNAVIDDNIFIMAGLNGMEVMDLQQLFGSISEIISALMHRFDSLPIHSIVYYQSYNQGVLQVLLAALNMRSGQCRTLRSKLDPTGNQQDCLGMTPLHILTCSSVHDLEMYRVIIENYPTNLITEDRWGAVPLLYAFWGAAPAEILTFLLESYELLHPGYVFNWTMMVETIGRCDTPKENIENVLWVKQMHFPELSINWDLLLDNFVQPSHYSINQTLFTQRMQFLVMCGMSDRVEAHNFQVWRDCITNMIHTANFQCNMDNTVILRRIQASVAHFVEELAKLKEITTILELAVWKMRMNETIPQEEVSRCQKKMKTDESSNRRQCRITCGADVVIRHILPYLITATDEESDSESDANDVYDNESSDSE